MGNVFDIIVERVGCRLNDAIAEHVCHAGALIVFCASWFCSCLHGKQCDLLLIECDLSLALFLKVVICLHRQEYSLYVFWPLWRLSEPAVCIDTKPSAVSFRVSSPSHNIISLTHPRGNDYTYNQNPTVLKVLLSSRSASTFSRLLLNT